MATATVIACDLTAISSTERPRHHNLTMRLRAAVHGRRELAKGYAYHIDTSTIALTEVAEWISMERLCCPFLTFRLSVAGREPVCHLSLTGPAGVKPLLNSEFPAHPPRDNEIR